MFTVQIPTDKTLSQWENVTKADGTLCEYKRIGNARNLARQMVNLLSHPAARIVSDGMPVETIIAEESAEVVTMAKALKVKAYWSDYTRTLDESAGSRRGAPDLTHREGTNMYTVTVLTREDGRFWQEGSFHFSTLESARKAASDLHDEEYSVVIRQTRRLIECMGMTRSEAKQYGAPASVGALED